MRTLPTDEPKKSLPIDGINLMREAAKKNAKTYLFDLNKDPYEQNDLLAKFPERAEALKQKLSEIEASCQRSRDGADYRH